LYPYLGKFMTKYHDIIKVLHQKYFSTSKLKMNILIMVNECKYRSVLFFR